MTHAENRLIAICDDLMAITTDLRRTMRREGTPIYTADVRAILDRILDTRNQISPPQTKPKTH